MSRYFYGEELMTVSVLRSEYLVFNYITARFRSFSAVLMPSQSPRAFVLGLLVGAHM